MPTTPPPSASRRPGPTPVPPAAVPPPPGAPDTGWDAWNPPGTAGIRRAAVLGVAALAGVSYTVVSIQRHQQFKTTIDITIFQQAIAQYAQLRAPLVLVKSQEPFSILGDHFSPVVALVAPLYRIWPSVVVLLLVQAALLAVAVGAVTGLAVRLLGGLGFAVGGAFALSWGMLKVVDFDFHEVGFTVAFLALASAALVEGRHRALVLWSAALLLTKEDSGLLVAGLGLVLMVTGSRRLGAGLVAAGALAVLVTVGVLIPAFSSTGTWTYGGDLGGDGSLPGTVAGLVETTVRHLTEPRGWALLVALAATASLGLRSPVILVLLPTVAARFASTREVYLEMTFYYDAPLMVVCFVALAVAIRDRRRRHGTTPARSRVWWSSAAGLTTVAVGLLAVDVGLHTTQWPRTLAESQQECPWCDDADRLIAAVPAGERLIADVGLLGNAADRHPVLMADPQWQDSTHLPLQADWVILYRDSDQFGAGWARDRERDLLARGYAVLDQGSGLVLLHRSSPGNR